MPFFVILDVSLKLVGRILLSDVECLNEYPYIMVKGVILPQGSKDLGKSLLWGESKLVKTMCSDSLIPRFVNNGYVAAELTCSTAHACQEVLHLVTGFVCVWIDIRTPPIK